MIEDRQREGRKRGRKKRQGKIKEGNEEGERIREDLVAKNEAKRREGRG